MKKIQVRYYAILREQAGKSEEALTTNATSPSALFDELKARYPFTLNAQQLKVAINAEFRDWQTPLNDGDSVVFIPPVAGG
jgi:molybdopterin converting factor subunit 1